MNMNYSNKDSDVWFVHYEVTEPTNTDRQRVSKGVCFSRFGIFFYDFIKNDLSTLGMVFFFLYALNSKVRSFRGVCSSHMFCLYISLSLSLAFTD